MTGKQTFMLLFCFQAYLQRLISLQPLPEYNRVAVRCLCTLLDAHPHFNFRENVIPAVVKSLASADDVVRFVLFLFISNVKNISLLEVLL